MNISWTSSEASEKADDADVSSSTKDTEETIVPTTISAEEKKKWFKQPEEHVHMVDKFVEVRADKRAMKDPIVSWEYDAARNIFILMRQRGFPHFMNRFNQFKTLPRWDLNRLDDLEIKNNTNNSTGSDFQTFMRRHKETGSKDLKPQKQRKMKLKKPDPSGRKKFRLKPHDPDVLTRVPLPEKIDECLQHATHWIYNESLGQIIIKRSDSQDIHIINPLMMHQFCEKDARKLAALPFNYGESKKGEAPKYLFYLQENIDFYNLHRLSSAMNALPSRRR